MAVVGSVTPLQFSNNLGNDRFQFEPFCQNQTDPPGIIELPGIGQIYQKSIPFNTSGCQISHQEVI